MGKLLYVEDDPQIASDVRDWLELDGHNVEIVHTGGDGLQLLSNYSFDLILVDWDLPDISGVELCQRFRRSGGKTWMIFLTAKSGAQNVSTGLDSGADDYLIKPFELRELSARVRSGLRRTESTFIPALEVCDLKLDIASRVMFIDDRQERLMPKEAALLEFFIRNPNKHFTTKMLQDSVWPSDSEASEGSVRTIILNLRKKLEKIGKPNLLKTVLGSGYILDTK